MPLFLVLGFWLKKLSFSYWKSNGPYPLNNKCPSCSYISDQTDELVDQGGQIKISGAPGAFDKEFRDMEAKLEEIRKIVEGHNVTSDDIKVCRSSIKCPTYCLCLGRVMENGQNFRHIQNWQVNCNFKLSYISSLYWKYCTFSIIQTSVS